MILEASGIEKWYFRGNGNSNRFFAVQKTDLTLQSGVLTVLTGRSGSGKTTLMNMTAGLLTPSAGTVTADGRDLYAMDDDGLSRLRNRHFGMIPQTAGMIRTLTAMENVLLASGIYKEDAAGSGRASDLMENAEKLMERLEIGMLGNAFPEELSGGELRRFAVVRALYRKPDVIFADEPTSDLDDENTKRVLSLLREAADAGAAVLAVTHDNEALAYADVSYRMNGGILERA